MTAKLSELEQASADRRSYGNPVLAGNAELKVIAEAMRELVAEVRLLRGQLAVLGSVVGAVTLPPASTPANRTGEPGPAAG